MQRELLQQEIMRVAAEEANRTKSELVSWVSHELRNPLTAVKGLIATLLRDTAGVYNHTTRFEFYETMERETARLIRLVNELLDLSTIQAGRTLRLNRQPVEVAAVLTRVARAQQARTTKHRIEVSLPPHLAPLVADEDRLDQILHNLVSNAIQYSPQGGTVRLEARDEEDGVVLSVADEGIGIPPEQMGRLFQPYERLDSALTEKIRGTGLGLYLVKHLVDAHEGTVSLESEVGKGSGFFVRLPRGQAGAESS